MAFDRTLVQIRERSYLDSLDLALVVIRHRPLTIALAALLGIVPWALINSWITAHAEAMRAFLHLYLIVLEAPLATAPLTIVLGSLMVGTRPRPRQVAVSIFRQIGPLLIYQVSLRSLLIGSVVLAWLVPTRLAFLNEIVLLERGKWWKVWSRCTDLSSERGGDLFGQWMAQVFFGSLFVVAFWIATSQVVGVLEGELTWGYSDWDFVFNTPTWVGVWIAVAFFAVVRFLSYIDQRIRLEGWEVELRLRAVGRTMREESDSW